MRAGLLLLFATACGFKGHALTSDGGSQPIDASSPSSDSSNQPSDAYQPDAMATVDASLAGCPTGAGWVQLSNNGHYYFSPIGQDKHWWQAESDCEMRGGSHLAVIGSLAEALTVGAQLNSAGVPYAWIGTFQVNMAPAKDLGWLFVAGGSAYRNWAGGEPNDGGNAVEMGKENFVQLYPSGQMNDTPGTDTLHYICECDGVPVSQTTLDLAPQDPT